MLLWRQFTVNASSESVMNLCRRSRLDAILWLPVSGVLTASSSVSELLSTADAARAS